jgi:hypothetical protein
MCENFVCVRLAEGRYKIGPTERVLPEPCYEHLNCQICELIYNCDFCASKDKCKHGSEKTMEKRKTLKNALKKNH